jgi:hypothetical protein
LQNILAVDATARWFLAPNNQGSFLKPSSQGYPSCLPGCLAFVETEDERFILERHAALEKREYVRFIIGRNDEDSHFEQGIFQAAAQALERQNITGSDADGLNELRAWSSENLEKPTSFGRDTLRLGIRWFKTDSTGNISRIQEMFQILERNGI